MSSHDRFSKLTDVVHDLDTHYTPHNMLTSRIDGTYFGCPPSLLLQLRITPIVLQDPRHLHEQRLSDHAPFIINIAPRAPLPPHERPVPAWLCRLPRFHEVMDSLAQNW